jgi:diguanylate cyclase (GGDEF)-like protein/PAS domain S-box-containing protein
VARAWDVAVSSFAVSRWIGRAGLRARLVIVVIAAIAPLLALLIASAVADREVALANARNRAVGLARLAAERQADILVEARELLAVLRRQPVIAGGDPAACHDVLETLVADHPQFNTIGVVGADGLIRCHSLITNRRPFGDRELFQRTMATAAPNFEVGAFLIGPISGKPTVVTASALERGPDGKPIGVVFVSINLTYFERVTADLVADDDRSVEVIETGSGALLARAPDPGRLTGRSFRDHPMVRALIASPDGGSIETDGIDGQPKVVGFAPVPRAGTHGIMVAVGLSRATVLAAANNRFAIGLALSVAATAAALGAAWAFGNVSQLRPIGSLLATAGELGGGNLAARNSLAPWHAPEYRALGATLNDMAAAIAEAQTRLRDRETELRLIADNSADMIFKLDRDLLRTYVSPASMEILGYQPSELIGRRSAEIVHPDDVATLSDNFRGLIAGIGRVSAIVRTRHRDGHWVWVEANMRTLVDPETGAPRGLIGSLRDNSARKAAEDALRASEALFRGVFDHTTDCILVFAVDPAGDFVVETCNPAAARSMGVAVTRPQGTPLSAAMPAASAAALREHLEQCVRGRAKLNFEEEAIFGYSRRKWDIVAAPILDADGHVVRIVMTARDITERKLGEALLRESGERFRLIADNVADLVVRLRPDLTCRFASPASRDLLGYEPEEIIDLPLVDVVHPDDRAALLADLRALQDGYLSGDLRFRACHASGDAIWVEATGRMLSASDGMILAIRDITRRKQVEDQLAAANERLHALASQDGLTGLRNRRSFDEAFDTEWRRAAREGLPLGLILLDVDRFKSYNDVHGHQAGDDCLRAVAAAIAGALRRPADLAARYGGEEFVVLLPNTDAAGTLKIAEDVRSAVEDLGMPNRGNGGVPVTISAGIWACIRVDGLSQREALRAADENLYAAKAAGRNRVHAASPELAPEIDADAPTPPARRRVRG